jgi:hypothetical protein
MADNVLLMGDGAASAWPVRDRPSKTRDQQRPSAGQGFLP